MQSELNGAKKHGRIFEQLEVIHPMVFAVFIEFNTIVALDFWLPFFCNFFLFHGYVIIAKTKLMIFYSLQAIIAKKTI